MVVSHESPKTREGYVTLVRTSALARRPGVVLLDEDLSALNALTGSTPASHNLVALLERGGIYSECGEVPTPSAIRQEAYEPDSLTSSRP